VAPPFSFPQSRAAILGGCRGRYHAVTMMVRVYSLRARGKRSHRSELTATRGDLRMYSLMIGSEMHVVARLCYRSDRSSNDRELLPPLYSPELVAIGEDSILLRGFQSVDGAAYVQEWRCELS